MIDGEEVPIASGSRTLSSSEMKYPQIEKEAISIIFGVKKVLQVSVRKKISTADRS